MFGKISTLTLALILSYTFLSSILYKSPQSQFQAWIQEHSKHYSNEEYRYRLSVFTETLTNINKHNDRASKGLESYTLGLNFMSDLTLEEFQEKYLLKNMEREGNYDCSGKQPVVRDMPDNFDWTAKGVITSVKKASGCAKAAYAIVSTETIESGRKITTGMLTPGSIQQILDCSSAEGNKGCTDGNVVASYAYVLQHGITTQAKYPYIDKDQACAFKPAMREWEILGCVKVTPLNETMMRAAIFRQPIAVSINAGIKSFKDYSSGVYDTSSFFTFNKCTASANHWVTVVGWGYDSASKKKFWKLKNSWGTSWGVIGYMYIVRSGDGAGECGIQSQLYYPLD